MSRDCRVDRPVNFSFSKSKISDRTSGFFNFSFTKSKISDRTSAVGRRIVRGRRRSGRKCRPRINNGVSDRFLIKVLSPPLGIRVGQKSVVSFPANDGRLGRRKSAGDNGRFECGTTHNGRRQMRRHCPSGVHCVCPCIFGVTDPKRTNTAAAIPVGIIYHRNRRPRVFSIFPPAHVFADVTRGVWFRRTGGVYCLWKNESVRTS